MTTVLPFDERWRRFEADCRDAGLAARAHAVALDRDPEHIRGLLDLPMVQFQRFAPIPPEYRGGAYLFAGHRIEHLSIVEGLIAQEQMSYGDPGVILASPGPSLAGVAVRTLGDGAQRARFYEPLIAGPAWTCFGLTEPGKGSAATELETRLRPAPDGDGYLLEGTKRYVGNAAHAQIGVVFCRRAPGPWGIEAVLVDPAAPGVSAELLPTVGLTGARIGELRFDAVRIAPEDLLGADRRPVRRGLLGAVATLLRFRPGLAATALGVTAAVVDYTRAERRRPGRAERDRLSEIEDRRLALRRIVYRVGDEIDHGRVNAHRIAAVKMRAARLVEDATLLAAELLGPGSLLEHPWLDKTYRDVRALEFMEGVGDIHRLSVFQGVLRGGFFEAGIPAEPVELGA